MTHQTRLAAGLQGIDTREEASSYKLAKRHSSGVVQLAQHPERVFAVVRVLVRRHHGSHLLCRLYMYPFVTQNIETGRYPGGVLQEKGQLWTIIRPIALSGRVGMVATCRGPVGWGPAGELCTQRLQAQERIGQLSVG